MQSAKELKALNEGKVGLVTYLEAVTALDVGFEAVEERFKLAREGGGGVTVMDKYQMEYQCMELQDARDKAAAAGEMLAANVTTRKKANKASRLTTRREIDAVRHVKKKNDE